jgi:N-carbamoylputrescine amidase
MSIIKAGLIQMSLKADASQSPLDIRTKMVEAHVPYIEEAGRRGVQVLAMQEIFNHPYFCPVEDPKWFEGAEPVPDGPTVDLMSRLASRYSMVIVAPLYELDANGERFNTAAVIDADGRFLGKYRKVHVPYRPKGSAEQYFFKHGDLGFPVFETAYCKLGVYICYDRHFPEGWRALALNGAQYIVNPSATVAQNSQYAWHLEQPAAAVANDVFIGAINRVGSEAPWNIGRFYGSSYFVDPRGKIISQASEDRDELLVADLDLALVDEMRSTWQFREHRRPDAYSDLCRL